MWIKRTPAEIAEEQRRRRRTRLRGAAFFGAFAAIVVTFLFSGREASRRGLYTIPASEIFARVPGAMLFGLICSLVWFKWQRKRPMMICPKCETTKYEDDTFECSCGGRFENMDEMKYVGRNKR